MDRAVFFDRDGVLNEDSPAYVYRPEDIVLLREVAEATRALKWMRFKLVVVSNQPAIAKNLATVEQVERTNSRLNDLILKSGGVRIDNFYFCPHHPQATLEQYLVDCDCRKPKPGLLLRAASELGIDLTKSYMVGDRITDIQAGKLAGCKKTILVRSKTSDLETYGQPDLRHVRPDYESSSLLAATRIIFLDLFP